MSVATTTNKIPYTLTTGSQALSVPFLFPENSHIKLIRVASETLPKAEMVLGVDYTLTGAGNPAGGTLTTIATIANGFAAGTKLVIKRVLPITQPTSYSPNDAFPAKVHEAALDRGIMIAQQSDEQSDRALRFLEDDSTPAELPPIADRANKALGFNATGGIEMKTVVGADGILEDESIGESALQGAFRSRAQASVALMKAQSYANAKTGDRVELLGYYARGDGGGGLLYVDKSDTTTADNGVTVFVAADGTRLKRPSGSINVYQAGAYGNWNGTTGNDDQPAFQRAVDAIYALSGTNYYPAKIEVPNGVYRFASPLIARPGMHLIGMGMGGGSTNLMGCRIQLDAPSGTMANPISAITIPDGCMDVSIEGIAFRSENKTGTVAIRAIPSGYWTSGTPSTSSNITIKDCDFYYFYRSISVERPYASAGVKSSINWQSDNWRIKNCRFFYPYRNAVYCESADGLDYSTIESCSIGLDKSQDPTGAEPLRGIEFERGAWLTIKNVAGAAFNTTAGGSDRDKAALIYDNGGAYVGPLQFENVQMEGVSCRTFDQAASGIVGPIDITFQNCLVDMPIYVNCGGRVRFLGGRINSSYIYIDTSDLTLTTDSPLTNIIRSTGTSISNTYVTQISHNSGIRKTKCFDGNSFTEFPVIVSKASLLTGPTDFITINNAPAGFYRVTISMAVTAASTYSVTCYSVGFTGVSGGTPQTANLFANLTLSNINGLTQASEVFYVPLVNSSNPIFIRGVSNAQEFVWAQIEYLGYNQAGF